MIMRIISVFSFCAFVFVAFVVLPVPAQGADKVEKIKNIEKIKIKDKDIAKKEFCSHSSWGNDKVAVTDLREIIVPATGRIEADGARNGGISVKGEARSDVLVRACVQSWGTTDEAARALISNIRVNTSGVIKADGPDDGNWSVSYEIRAPHNSNLSLKAHNGGIAIKSIEGSVDATTTNGGISIYDAAGDVRGRTTNGGVSVALVGNGWKGSGLDLQTTNGGVNLVIPSNFAATVEAGTVNGGFSSDFPELSVQKDDPMAGHKRSKQVRATLNGGGATIRLVTTNGGVRISSSDKGKGY